MWEDQGRQYHQWFGHGTSGAVGVPAVPGVRAVGGEEISAVVGAGAAVFLEGARRAAYERYLGAGGREELGRALPIWAAASGLDADRFRALVVGAGLSAEAAGSLQEVGRLVAGARDAGDLRAASAALGRVVSGSGADWRFGLRYARDQAVFASVQGVVPGGGGLALPVMLAPAGAVAAGGADSALVGTAGRVGLALGELGPWGWVAAGVLGAGVGAHLIWERLHGAGAGAGSIVEARPPADLDDEGGGGRFRKPKANGAPPELERNEAAPPGKGPGGDGDAAPPAGDLRRLSRQEVDEAARREGYESGEAWKQKEFRLDSKTDIARDRNGNLYTIQRQGPVLPVPLYRKLPR